MATTQYPDGLAKLLSEGADNVTAKVILLDNTFTPDAATQSTVADIVAEELSGTGYSSAARPTISNFSATNDLGTVEVFGDDLSITSLDVGTIAAVAIYLEGSGDDSTHILLTAVSGLAIVTSGADQPINFPATGLLALAAV